MSQQRHQRIQAVDTAWSVQSPSQTTVRWVSKPKWARLSSKVVSMLALDETRHVSPARSPGHVEPVAGAERHRDTRTHRSGSTGWPPRYHAVPLLTCNRRTRPSYQRTRRHCQGVGVQALGQTGQRLPLTGFPACPAGEAAALREAHRGARGQSGAPHTAGRHARARRHCRMIPKHGRLAAASTTTTRIIWRAHWATVLCRGAH